MADMITIYHVVIIKPLKNVQFRSRTRRCYAMVSLYWHTNTVLIYSRGQKTGCYKSKSIKGIEHLPEQKIISVNLGY